MPAEDGGDSTDEYRTCFGIRSFGDNGSGRLALNGRAIFLRGEAKCAEYRETGAYTHDNSGMERDSVEISQLRH